MSEKEKMPLIVCPEDFVQDQEGQEKQEEDLSPEELRERAVEELYNEIVEIAKYDAEILPDKEGRYSLDKENILSGIKSEARAILDIAENMKIDSPIDQNMERKKNIALNKNKLLSVLAGYDNSNDYRLEKWSIEEKIEEERQRTAKKNAELKPMNSLEEKLFRQEQLDMYHKGYMTKIIDGEKKYCVPSIDGEKQMTEKEFDQYVTERYIDKAVAEKNSKREKARIEYEKSQQEK